MQRIAARVALDERRPTRSLLDIAAHIEEDAAAPVATSRGSRVQAYDGALPQLESGAIHPRIDPEPAGASVALALAMAEAGFQPRGALPEAPSPHEWIVRVIDATISDCVPSRTHAPLSVGLLSGPDAQQPVIALELPVDGTHIVALQPALAALRSDAAALAACSIVNDTLFLMGPERMFYEISGIAWQGEEDEATVQQEYAAQGETYDGVTRAQWDRVYPVWTRRCSRAQLREGLKALAAIARGRGRARKLARALLELGRARRAAAHNRFRVNLAEAVGLDGTACWGVPMVWSREENLTAMVLDEMYQLAMQTSCDMSVLAMQFHEPTDLRAMRAFRKAFTASLREFTAASELCILMKEMEETRCTKS
jgi:hypothetical protein